MLHPAPTTKIDPKLTRGVIRAVHEATATKPRSAVLSLHNSDYELHVAPPSSGWPEALAPGSKVIGRLRASARRVDICRTGGKYVDPVVGTPRRVQGKVIGAEGGVLMVDAGAVFALRLAAPGQKPEQFELGSMITCEVLPGATFEVTG
ncbi:MAG: hypothetical protein RIB60_07690 [Phycisphaerales bacterium]